MSVRFEIRLFGGLTVLSNDKPISGLASRKAEALLAYLACNPRPLSREWLANLLWDERSEERAMGNLRVLLTSMRKQIGDILEISRPTIRMVHQTELIWVDAVIFQTLLAPITQSGFQAAPLAPELVTAFEQALALYRGEFLAGFSIRDAPQFEDWASNERERRHMWALQAAEYVTAHYLATEQHSAGVNAAQRWLALDALNEEAHRMLMRLLAQHGQRAAALEHYKVCRELLHKELDVEPSSETTQLYEQIRAAALEPAMTAAAPVSAPSVTIVDRSKPPTNLPAPLTTILGRERELALIRQRLEDPACRLLTLVGIGGIGKTSLAVEAGRSVVGPATPGASFADGVYFVRLEHLNQIELWPSAIANAINLLFQGSTDPKTQIINFLRPRRLLLIIDNFEQWLEQSDFLLEILQTAPHVKILVTSRERLNLQGEWLIEVKGLGCPPLDSTSSRNQRSIEPAATKKIDWSRYPAAQLFIRSAQALQPDFDPASQATAIHQICQDLAGLPLGIQLAAAWVRTFSCQQIADAIRQNLDFLATTMRNLPERHRNLRAIFDHSWTLLLPAERGAFQSLAVFPGNFTAQAAQTVAGVTAVTLNALIDKSLLQPARAEQEQSSGENLPRYQMHPVLFQYALEKLEMFPNAGILRDRHCEYYATLLHTQGQRLNSRDSGQALLVIDADLDNIRASWRHAVSTFNIATLTRSVEGLVKFYLLRGLLQEADTMLTLATEQIAAMVAEGIVLPSKGAALYSCLLAYQAEVLNERGFSERAIPAAEAAITWGRKGNTSEGEALGYLQWGNALQAQAKYTEAQPKLNRCLTLAEAAQLRLLQAGAYHFLGRIALYQGDYQAGAAQHEKAIQLYQELGNRLKELRAYNSLAMVHLYGGDYTRAREHYERCLAGYREMGDRPAVAVALNNLGAVCAHLGIYDQARLYYDESLMIKEEIGDRQTVALILANLSLLFQRIGVYERALEYALQALHITQELGARDTEAYARLCLGHALAGLGRLNEAAENYEEAFTLRRSQGQVHQSLEPLAGLANVVLTRGASQQAQAYVEEILSHLTPNTFAGIVELIRIYLICYRVLAANEDARAEQVLQIGYRILQQRAAQISNEAHRRSLLENVPAHRELIAEYQKHTVIPYNKSEVTAQHRFTPERKMTR